MSIETPTKKFDPQMIKDFLDYLILELRINHFEHQTNNSINPELLEMLTDYLDDYGVGTIPNTALHVEPDDSEEDASKANQILKKRMLNQRQKQIDAFEVLLPVFADALKCVVIPLTEGNPTTAVKVKQLLSEEELP